MQLPREWHRGPQWASPAARAQWEPVVAAAAAAWAELEVMSVSDGLRPGALLTMTPEELVRATREATGQGLEVTPLTWDGSQHRAALHRPGARGEWVAAWARSDDDAVGRLLGFPDCCRAWFLEHWAIGKTETVLTLGAVDGPLEANTMLRWLGVRLVPHLPCSALCRASVELGQAIADRGRLAGVDVVSLHRLLALPVTYRALHGVAIIETPHLRFIAGTDWTAEEITAKRAEIPPRWSTCGCCHDPYCEARDHHHDGPASALGPAAWEDNGFRSREAMAAAHDVVLSVAATAENSAIDLGAGDGELLSRLSALRAGAWVGVELDRGRAERGMHRHRGVQLVCGRIQDWPSESHQLSARRYDVALLMPGRLLEMSQDEALAVRRWLSRRTDRIVAYAYGDWLGRYGNLEALCHAAGLQVADVATGPGVAAGVAAVLQ